MSYKLVATWSAPKAEDEAEFERYYIEDHVPVAANLPYLKRLVLTKTDGKSEDGGEPPYYRVAELIFDSQEELEKCSASTQWTAMREDAGALIDRFGVTLEMGLGEEQEVPVA
ncbi:EthD family reductase [Nocardia jiangxiensis]|uniref:EthD family reductase n=1 Tax=Nocardia jiangxiensis TaxID=282685 RepID=A0ABW6SCP0_9NOCA|nr:EthD family reductase [Nocardia jiangxiensis]